MPPSWSRTFAVMSRRSRMSSGNVVRVHEDGDALLDDLWRDIDGATREVLLEMYIIEPDKVGLCTLEALEAAARRGCSVFLACDAVGSAALPAQRLRAIEDAGGRTLVFNPPLGHSPLRRRFGLFQRNHRKLAVIDGRVAYTGGANLSEDYGGVRHGNGLFVDTHLRIEGPAVAVLRESLLRLFEKGTMSSRPRRFDAAPAATASARAGGAPTPGFHPDDCAPTVVQVLESFGRRGKREIQREMRLAIESSGQAVDIATPYFVPPRRIADALVAASRRGVRVRLLTAGRSDVPAVAFAARHVYARLLRRGVRIFELQRGVLHAKTFWADGKYAMVGSANLDQWSHKRNLELNVGLAGDAVLERLRQGFERRLASAGEVTLERHQRRPFWRRLLEWLAYVALSV